MVTSGQTRLVLLYGGQSAEHEVSCISALHVLHAADPARYDVRLVGITTSGAWVDATEAVGALGAGAKALPQPDSLAAPLAIDSAHEVGASLVSATAATEGPIVVFPVLHGPMGEDGTVQGLLEMAGVAYIGAGVTGSATAMDKGIAKALFAAAGIPQARYLALRAPEVDDLLAKTVEAELGWPVFVKPANLGSTIGISRAANGDELRAAVDLALQYDEYLVIEEALRPREIEVGVLGDAELRVSVPGEILPSRDFYDFEDKYLAGTAQWQIPADLPLDIAAQIPDLARAACRALRVEGMARVDFFYEEDSGRLLVNEINTIPGFTPISMYPQMWAASGVSYSELLDELVAGALARHERRSHFRTSRPGA
jgi:D-alanine-D-alanine ligase